jgi:hypothetical protein
MFQDDEIVYYYGRVVDVVDGVQVGHDRGKSHPTKLWSELCISITTP